MYDDDDENTSNPKLEKIINQDKERIEQERKEQLDKKKSKKDITRDEKSKHKMESSANNFNTFLSMDNDDKVPEQPTTSSAKVQSDDDDIVEVKGKSPAKVDLSDSPGASQSMPKMPDETDSDDSDLPPVWKLKNKRPSTAHEQSASKRLRISTSSESDTPEDVDISRILSGVVFVISGIQVNIYIFLRKKCKNCSFVNYSGMMTICRIQIVLTCAQMVLKWEPSTNRTGIIRAHTWCKIFAFIHFVVFISLNFQYRCFSDAHSKILQSINKFRATA